jgi:predicted lactoylglutathione lyase
MHQQMIFVNLATNDVAATTRFFTALGFTVNPRFPDDDCASVVISDTIVVILQSKRRFAEQTDKEIADSAATRETLICLSAERCEKVDELDGKAIAAGGTATGRVHDHEHMYGRAFDDLDGHTWEFVWMDPSPARG